MNMSFKSRSDWLKHIEFAAALDPSDVNSSLDNQDLPLLCDSPKFVLQGAWKIQTIEGQGPDSLCAAE